MTTAHDLLTESLPHLSGGLQARVRAFLEQPVHVGDTITLRAVYPTPDEQCVPSSDLGFKFVPYTSLNQEFDYETRKYTGEIAEYNGTHTLYPEAGAARCYDWEDLAAGIVVPINGRNYRVGITVAGAGDWGSPDEAVVTFTRTDDAETEYKPFDHQAEVLTLRALLEHRLLGYREVLAKIEAGDKDWGSPESFQQQILEHQLRIANLESGAERMMPEGPVTLFGQPQFIQNEISPRTKHEAARHLATLDTNWADSGNVNIMFACDEEGVPCAAWLEASCC
jgi:hypothetical protein